MALFHAGLLCQAETLFESDFGSQQIGEIGANRSMANSEGGAHFWQGPNVGEYGRFAIAETPDGAEGGSGKSVLAIYDNSPEKNKAPTFFIRLSSEPEKVKQLTVEEKILIPVAGPYQALIGIGKGSWAGAAAVFSIRSGKIEAWSPGDVFTNVGRYSPNVWMVFRVVLDLEKKTYDVYVDGIKTGSSIPWAFTKNTSLTYFEVVSDLQPADRMGEAVFYIEYVKIATN